MPVLSHRTDFLAASWLLEPRKIGTDVVNEDAGNCGSLKPSYSLVIDRKWTTSDLSVQWVERLATETV